MRADLSRRQILTGLLATPVVAPAAAMGMVEAVKGVASAETLAGATWSRFASGPVEDIFVGGLYAPEGLHVVPGSDPLRVWVNDEEIDLSGYDWDEAAGTLRFNSSSDLASPDSVPAVIGNVSISEPAVVQPLVEIDETADEIVELTFDLGQTVGHSGDPLDEDAATYCAVA